MENPVFWLRLVGYGSLCQRFVDERGEGLGFQKRAFDVPTLVREAADHDMSGHPEKYAGAILGLMPPAG